MTFLPLALAAALLSTGASALQAAPIRDALHAFGLNRSYADELGGNPLVAQGGKLLAQRYRFTDGQGLSLTGGVPAQTYSIELQLTPSDTFGYHRLIEFRIAGSDNGLYIRNGTLEFYPVTTGTPVSITAGVQSDIVITRDGASRMVSLYVDGVLQTSFEDSMDMAVFDVQDASTVAKFFLDDNDENTAGSLNHLRTWDLVLTADEVVKLANGKRPGNVTSK